jgi:multiple sugar transport system substrate-binding protein
MEAHAMAITIATGVPFVTRRRLLTSTGFAAAGAASGLFTPYIARGDAQTKTLTIVQWSHFVPAFDTWFDKFAADWGRKNGIAVTVDHIPEQDVAARAAAEAAARSGHDLFMWNGAGGAHLYRKYLVDMSKLVDYVEKKYARSARLVGKLPTTPTTTPGPPIPTTTSTTQVCIAKTCGTRSA